MRDKNNSLRTLESQYLGLPTCIGRSKKEIFAGLEERVRNKVGNWKVRFLSKAGREILIKAVLQAIPAYVMSCFLIPKDTCDRIEKRLCDFYWGSMNGERKMHWRSWGKMCRSKREGGLGFRRLQCFNKAMLAKQAWRLLSTPQSLTARIYKARYYPRSSILDSNAGFRPSHAWNSIMKGVQLLRTGLEWRVGNGELINIWNDHWLPESALGHPSYWYPGSDLFKMVSELRLPDSPYWNEDLLSYLFKEEDVKRIRSIRISHRLPTDVLRWKFTKDGLYTVRSGYYQDFANWWSVNSIPQLSHNVPHFWSCCWNLGCPPRLMNFLWRLLDNNLPVRDILYRRGILQVATCPFCNQESETITHLFMTCSTSKTLLLKVGIQVALNPELPFGAAWLDFVQTHGKSQGGRLCAAFWGVWKIRNNLVFGNNNQNQDDEMNKAVRFYDEFVKERNSTPGSRITLPAKWTPPSEGVVKINTDAGVLDRGGGQISAIARDHNGVFIRAAIKHIPETQHPTLLEAHGILLGLYLAKEIAANYVSVESDCLPIIRTLQTKRLDRGDLSLILEDCLSSASEFELVQFMHTPRAANTPAHLLAKLPVFSSENVLFIYVLHSEIVASLDADVMTLF